jgi:thioesterase domain-containing protein
MNSIETEAGGGKAGESADSASFPCSYTQVRIWFAQQLDPDSAHWNVAMRWRLEGRLREATVERAWQMLLDRHEALRTGIEDVDGLPQQRVWAKSRLKFGNIDLSRLPPLQRTAAAEEIAEKEARTPIVLRPEGMHFRVQLVRLDENVAYLLTTFHHIIVDGWSVGVLMREFGEIVSSLSRGEMPTLPELPVQHVDYALWQADTLAGGGYDADRAYWKNNLANLRRFEVPTDKPRSAIWSYDCDIRTLLLPRDLSDSLNRFAGRHACTPFHVATATLTSVLTRLASVDDVVLGTQVACRTHPDLKSLVGPLFNSVILRLDASGDPSLFDLLQRCQKRSLEAMEHQQLPFNFVVDDLRQRRDASRHPVYSISITTQSAHIDTGAHQDLEFGGLRIVALPSLPVGAMMDLECVMVGREEGWRLSCIANTSLFDVATVDTLLARWALAIDVLVDGEANARVSTLETMSFHRFSVSAVSSSAQPRLPEPAPVVEATDLARDNSLVREKVARVWKELLGGIEITPDTDFFDAGGHSLTALRVVARLNEHPSTRTSIRNLMMNPVFDEFLATLAGPGPVIRTQQPNSRTRSLPAISPIVALNQGAAFRAVSRGIGDHRPILDVSVGDKADVAFAKSHSFREVAATIAQRVVAVQPNGPYTLMAYCALGPLALETARELTTQGRKVDLLILLNTHGPDYEASLTRAAKRIRRRAIARETWRNFNILRRMHSRGEITTWMFLQHYSIIRRSSVSRFFDRSKRAELLPDQDNIEALLEFPDVIRQGLISGPPLPGPVECDAIIVRTSDMLKGPSFPAALGWKPWISGQVKVCDIEGTHSRLLHDPVASLLGARLAATIEDLEREREAKRPKG